MEIGKVTKGLECALGTPGRRDCNNCPYDEEFNCLGCIGVMNDAINLLREREPVKPVKCGYAWVCGACEKIVGIVFDDENDNFCSRCGRPVLW